MEELKFNYEAGSLFEMFGVSEERFDELLKIFEPNLKALADGEKGFQAFEIIEYHVKEAKTIGEAVLCGFLAGKMIGYLKADGWGGKEHD